MSCIRARQEHTWLFRFFVVVAVTAMPGFWGCGEENEDVDLNVLPFLTSDNDGHTHVVYLPYEDVYGPKIGGVILQSSLEQRHSHEVHVRQNELLGLVSGGTVVRPTSNVLGHQHQVVLSLGAVKPEDAANFDAGAAVEDAGLSDGGVFVIDAAVPNADAMEVDAEVDAAPDPISACGPNCESVRID